ncbi:hypothetical protein AB0O91_15665 [Kitasatospora sp. NPDC089797]|uniref:hypothetical protein n=1 Tax=Kitasatospora sp. NPDC089797 TaxID=3155298 RepID=UPI0034459889
MHETRTTGGRATARPSRPATVLAVGAAALLALAGPVHAAPAGGPLPRDIPDYQAALDLVKSADVHDAVCRFLSVPLPQGNAAGDVQRIPDQADPCQGVPAFTVNDPLALNELAPGFVAGTLPPIPASVVQLSGLVSGLNAPVNGRKATVMLAPTDGGGWHLAAVRDGDGDAAYAGKATPGAPVFSEPQIRGWYQLGLTSVQPLNDQARQGLNGQDSVPLGDYQKLVKARYADKQPGSAYDTAGMSSGYGSAPAAAPSSTPALVGGAGAGAAVGLAGAVFVVRRRRRTAD